MAPRLESPRWWPLAARTWWFAWLVGAWLWYRPSPLIMLCGFGIAAAGLGASVCCWASIGELRSRAWHAVEAADDLLYCCLVPAIVTLLEPSGWLWLLVLLVSPFTVLFLFSGFVHARRAFGRT